MDREELKAIVAQMLRELAPAQTPPSPPPVKGAETAPEAPPDDGVLPDLTTVDLRAQYLVPNAAHGAEFRALKAKTPARLGLGRCGARYPTASLLRFRADHAAAQDSVFSLVPERFWEENHYPFVQTMCKSKDEYLTRPDLGRRFDEKNQAVLRDLLAGQRVVLAVGDGLSSAAVQANAPDCCAAIRQGLQAQGLTGKGDLSPYDMGKRASDGGFETAFDGTDSSFLVSEAASLGLSCEALSVDAGSVRAALEGGAVLVCNVGPGDFTDNGHFFVVTGIDGDGNLRINDPYSAERSNRAWDVDTVLGQTKALWAYRLA